MCSWLDHALTVLLLLRTKYYHGLILYSVKVAEQDAMKDLMQNNPDRAQKLLIAVMKHPASLKRKADDMS